MSELADFIFGPVFIFLGTTVLMLNLVTMFPNANYSAEWWKVVLAIGMVVTGFVFYFMRK